MGEKARSGDVFLAFCVDKAPHHACAVIASEEVLFDREAINSPVDIDRALAEAGHQSRR